MLETQSKLKRLAF